MNRLDMIDLRELLERIDRFLKEYMRASNPEQLAILEAEITAAKKKLQRIAASRQLELGRPSLAMLGR
jgi:hypothetical protein